MKKLFNSLFRLYFKQFKPSFQFNKQTFHYFCDDIGYSTHRNERAVEVPIALDFINKFENKRVLEVGNVLKKYSKTLSLDYTILDKYEKESNVINEDILDFNPSQKFDAVVSVSTLEHIGFDEPQRSRDKIPQVLNHIKNKVLKRRGGLLITAPIGYNSWLDNYILSEKDSFEKVHFLKRVSILNFWKECQLKETINTKYNFPYSAANAIFIGLNFKKNNS